MTDIREFHTTTDRFCARQRKADAAVDLVRENVLSPSARPPVSIDCRGRHFLKETLNPGFRKFRGAQDVAWSIGSARAGGSRDGGGRRVHHRCGPPFCFVESS
ncbi:hypothetical protein [Streptomyces sp. NPDC005573]|uniref:hypothetical protein n=1 Tax=Streptomyces sp. NPDC005573 TaxID=3156890 RepID=UPI0033A08DBB